MFVHVVDRNILSAYRKCELWKFVPQQDDHIRILGDLVRSSDRLLEGLDQQLGDSSGMSPGSPAADDTEIATLARRASKVPYAMIQRTVDMYQNLLFVEEDLPVSLERSSIKGLLL